MMKRIIAIIASLCLVIGFSACGKEETTTEDSVGSVTELTTEYVELQTAAVVTDYNASTTVALNGNSAQIDGGGAEFTGGDLVITAAGSYSISGSLADGRIIVNAPKQQVSLILDGVDISCSDSAAVLIYASSETTIAAAAGSVNTFRDGSAYSYSDSYSSETDSEPNACIFSKSDLIIGGEGTINVTGSFNNGIVSKDTLQISCAEMNVNAANNGINGKDCNIITGTALTVTAGGDGLRSTNDTDASLGYITISDANITITSGEDGIQAEKSVAIKGGSINITAGGGSSATATTADLSTKGIKSGTTLIIASGSITVDSLDDSLHAGGNIEINGGTLALSTGDDGVHSDTALTVSGGDITVSKSYEGLEANSIDIKGGTIHITASDDGINAAGGTDSSGFGGMDSGFGGFGGFGSGSSSVTISGGYTVINARGDGLDSNGTVSMSGGTVIIHGPEDSGNGALDYDSTFTLTGGTFIALGAAGMAQSPNDVSEYGFSVTFNTTLAAGTYVSISDGSDSFVIRLEKSASNLIYASPEVKGNTSYTVSYGGSYSGTCTDGICSGGTYSGGTTLATITTSDYMNAYGSVGIGGSMGGGMMNGGGWGRGGFGGF